MPTTAHRHLFRRHGLLGTVIDATVTGAGSAAIAADAAAACFGEIERLQRVFNVFDEHSELRRWRSGETAPGPELTEVNALAAAWRERSGGAFDPAAGALMTLWDTARSNGALPDGDAIAHVIDEMGRGVASDWSLNAIAKGWIVDRAVRHAFRPDAMSGLTVNAGGDLLTLGASPIIVGIEDPHRPFDNVPPLTRVAVHDAALATSGRGRRGWSIAGVWYGHVVDPRTGWPVGHVASASVVAPDAATADVVATVLAVLPIAEGVAFADGLDLACLILDAAGDAHRNHRWCAAEEAATAVVGSATSRDLHHATR